MMAERGPDWSRPWGVSKLLWNSAAMAYLPLRIYIRAGDRLLFELWLRSRPLMWWLEDKMGATHSYDGYSAVAKKDA